MFPVHWAGVRVGVLFSQAPTGGGAAVAVCSAPASRSLGFVQADLAAGCFQQCLEWPPGGVGTPLLHSCRLEVVSGRL